MIRIIPDIEQFASHFSEYQSLILRGKQLGQFKTEKEKLGHIMGITLCTVDHIKCLA